MKIIAVSAVTAGGKTTVVNEIKKRLPRCASLHFDDYSFEGEVEDFHQWVLDGADYVCRYRREDDCPHEPSSIIKIHTDGSFKIIRA